MIKINLLKGGIYNMKKIISLFMMAFLLVGTLSIVAAEEVEDAVPEPARIGFFQNQMFKLNMAFTFNKEKKIEKTLEMAEKRLAEAELLAEEDPEAYEKAQERYNDLVAKAEEILDGIEGNGDENSSAEYMSKIARIQNQFERHRDHADEVYTRALERFEANNASDEKIERFEMFHERALNRSNAMEERALEKRENAIRKHKALSEMSDEELEGLLENIESNEGLTKAREVRTEQFQKRVEKLEVIGANRLERAQERFDNANLSEGQKEVLRERIERTEGQLEEMGERLQERFEVQGQVAEKRTENIVNAIESELAGRRA